MSDWTSSELEKIGQAEELELASLRGDGTLRRPVTIWVVRIADDLYVRSVNGRSATWFRGAEERHEGHISAGGVEKDVAFIDTADLSSEIDAAFKTKYHRYAASIVNTELTPQAHGATLRLTPRA